MKLIFQLCLFSVAMMFAEICLAQMPVLANPNHDQLLASKDSQLAANKRLVYDFWRKVLEAGHLDLADQYLTESYIQHNPEVPTGRKGFVDFFSAVSKSVAIQDKVQAPLVDIVAERNIVILSFTTTLREPSDPSKTYTSTWFDMFRIEGNKIAEHWDPTIKQGDSTVSFSKDVGTGVQSATLSTGGMVLVGTK